MTGKVSSLDLETTKKLYLIKEKFFTSYRVHINSRKYFVHHSFSQPTNQFRTCSKVSMNGKRFRWIYHQPHQPPPVTRGGGQWSTNSQTGCTSDRCFVTSKTPLAGPWKRHCCDVLLFCNCDAFIDIIKIMTSKCTLCGYFASDTFNVWNRLIALCCHTHSNAPRLRVPTSVVAGGVDVGTPMASPLDSTAESGETIGLNHRLTMACHKKVATFLFFE